MIRTCKCGGRVAPYTATRYVAVFLCDRCGKLYSQRKRQPRVDTSDIPEADEAWFKKAKLRTRSIKA